MVDQREGMTKVLIWPIFSVSMSIDRRPNRILPEAISNETSQSVYILDPAFDMTESASELLEKIRNGQPEAMALYLEHRKIELIGVILSKMGP